MEEDSARKLDTISTSEGQAVIWNLDRLGIPLIEIATAPDVVDPEHAKSTAKALGGLLDETGGCFKDITGKGFLFSIITNVNLMIKRIL